MSALRVNFIFYSPLCAFFKYKSETDEQERKQRCQESSGQCHTVNEGETVREGTNQVSGLTLLLIQSTMSVSSETIRDLKTLFPKNLEALFTSAYTSPTNN